MLEIVQDAPDSIRLIGRLDAVQSERAFAAFDLLEGDCTVHFEQLDYISSAGLSVLLHTQQRLSKTGGSIKLRGLNPHVKQVFEYAGFNTIFDMS
ncbi:MAG: STAS domain-containing protein [Bacteroidetes bacterium]|nr:STAS domain-containing protein [Bacteroidota bacterium]